jgi:hypothetical protein
VQKVVCLSKIPSNAIKDDSCQPEVAATAEAELMSMKKNKKYIAVA